MTLAITVDSHIFCNAFLVAAILAASSRLDRDDAISSILASELLVFTAHIPQEEFLNQNLSGILKDFVGAYFASLARNCAAVESSRVVVAANFARWTLIYRPSDFLLSLGVLHSRF